MHSQPDLKLVRDLSLWLSCWMIHDDDHLRRGTDGLRVRGHQVICASMATIVTARHCLARRPQDRVAVKPHAGPLLRALQYLAGNQTLANIRNFRGYAGTRSHPGRTKDRADVHFSTGSIGLGAAITAFASFVRDDVRVRGRISKPECRMFAHSWLGSMHGHRVADLGVAHLGHAGGVSDPCPNFRIDRNSILHVIESLSPRRPLRAIGRMG